MYVHMVPCSSIHLAYISLAAHIQYIIDTLDIDKFTGKNGSMSLWASQAWVNDSEGNFGEKCGKYLQKLNYITFVIPYH